MIYKITHALALEDSFERKPEKKIKGTFVHVVQETVVFQQRIEENCQRRAGPEAQTTDPLSPEVLENVGGAIHWSTEGQEPDEGMMSVLQHMQEHATKKPTHETRGSLK